MRIVIVRHGQAAAKKSWQRADAERPLVARGHRQAARLGKIIGAPKPTRVISSPALRCIETVQPLADKYGLDVELSEQLATDAGDQAVALCRQLLSSPAPHSTVMVCTHREVLNDLLPQLAKEFGGKLGHRPPGAKGGAWILRFRGGTLQKVEYHPPAA
jgi:8-oxo-dGTP diphosphatase